MIVLIVEDDLSVANLLLEALEADGIRVIGIARTVEEALDLAAHHQFDFAIVDIKLAGKRLGSEFGTHLRTETSDSGIIFSTGNASQSLTLKDGDAVMTKPYRLRDMARAVRILHEIGCRGVTRLAYPRNFRLLGHAATQPSSP